MHDSAAGMRFLKLVLKKANSAFGLCEEQHSDVVMFSNKQAAMGRNSREQEASYWSSSLLYGVKRIVHHILRSFPGGGV